MDPVSASISTIAAALIVGAATFVGKTVVAHEVKEKYIELKRYITNFYKLGSKINELERYLENNPELGVEQQKDLELIGK